MILFKRKVKCSTTEEQPRRFDIARTENGTITEPPLRERINWQHFDAVMAARPEEYHERSLVYHERERVYASYNN